MPDWLSPNELFKDACKFYFSVLFLISPDNVSPDSRLTAISPIGPGWAAITIVIYQKFMLVLLGLYTWEIITHLPLDWRVVSRKCKLYWPLFFYIYCKYSLWVGLISFNLIVNVTTKIDCQARFTIAQFAIATAAGSASTLLMLRTIALWERAPNVMVPLIVVSLGLWGLLLSSVGIIRGSWDDAFGACMSVIGNSISGTIGLTIFIYMMLFDFTVLALTTIRLLKFRRFPLPRLLFRHGVAYFLISFTAYLLPTIFLFLDLNEIMDVMFVIPAVTASSIVSCRLFVSLSKFKQGNVSAVPHPVAEHRPGGGFNTDAAQAHLGNGKGLATKMRAIRNAIAEIACRGMAAGIDSMGGIDEPSAERTTSTISVLDLRREPDPGDVHENRQVAAVHVQVMRHDDGDDSFGVDLEKAESVMDVGRKKEFAPDV